MKGFIPNFSIFRPKCIEQYQLAVKFFRENGTKKIERCISQN
jgi:hypothetical protein